MLRVMSRSRYHPDPNLRGQPLTSREVEEILEADGKGVVGDKKKVVHLLERMLATFATFRRDIDSLNSQVEQLNLEAHAGWGRPTTADPADALRFASEQDIMRVVDGFERQKLERYNAMLAEVEQLRSHLLSQQQGLTLLRQHLTADQQIPEDTKTALLRLLDHSADVPAGDDDTGAAAGADLPEPLPAPHAADPAPAEPGEAAASQEAAPAPSGADAPPSDEDGEEPSEGAEDEAHGDADRSLAAVLGDSLFAAPPPTTTPEEDDR